MSEGSQGFLIALAGNPNCGKTTLFNTLTGARQHVGNYPGITVEKKEGFTTVEDTQLRLVDLPGTYSLTAYSLEELVARDFLTQDRPEAVINIVDASNLERNLYLTVQLMELGIPLLLALNMMDAAEGRGIVIDTAELSQRLRLPVVPMVARLGKGKAELLNSTVELAKRKGEWVPLHIAYGPDIDPALSVMEKEIRSAGFLTDTFPPRWTALKYLEADEQVMARGKKSDPALSMKLETAAQVVSEHLEATLDTYPEAIIADHRYGFIAALLKGGVLKRNDKADRLYLSDQLDRVLTHTFLGPVIMGVILYLVYQFTFNISKVPIGWLEAGFSSLADFVESALPPGPVKSLVISGIIDGVGGVVGFVPLILFMFLAIALLEDTGYLARVAYMLDRVFRIFGLHGSSVMAYIISGGIAGGCAVPGVMATRTLRSPRERLATLLTAPFMNCGAKLPVFAMLIAAFFPARHTLAMFVLTLLSWCAALLLAKFIRLTLLRGPSTPFLLELPPYRLPTLKGLLIHTGERTWQYIQKAGTIILAISILFWALMSFPGPTDVEKARFESRRQAVTGLGPERSLQELDHEEALANLKQSFAGRLGTSLETFSQWAGFDWRANVALLSGFAAKELIISTLGTAYSLGASKRGEAVSISDRLAGDPGWNGLRAFAFMVFVMLYAPCFATVVCMIKESGTWKWGVFSIVFNTTIAFVMAVVIYQGGRWLGMGI